MPNGCKKCAEQYKLFVKLKKIREKDISVESLDKCL